MARTKKEAADSLFADPANPTLHELNQYTQSLLRAPVAASAAAEPVAPEPVAEPAEPTDQPAAQE